MKNKVLIFFLLFGFYYIFSGINEPFFIITGIISSFLGLYVAVKMDVIKSLGIKGSISSYWLWLVKEVFLSTVTVLKHIWSPKLDINPCFVDVETLQDHEMGYAIYGNSITLTPGTVCVYIDDDYQVITAHALTDETKADLESGVMDRKIKKAMS